ncbi:MAG: GSCFA domain-containing protein, partial [Bacteroidetes bacterium]|nr:GSCFA domain-containing protein [Bacteroidota bacterium]
MIKFRTELNVEPYKFSIQFNSNLLFLGSCFANSIGNKFAEHKFQATVNPHGVVFNPVSIAKQIELALFSQQLPDWSFVETEGLLKNLFYHGQ